MHRTIRLVWAVVCAPLLHAACSVEAAAPSRPDVVMVTLDTTRADWLGPFAGVQRSKRGVASTPFMDELAAESVVFENAWTGSTWTGPSMATIFTGLTPPRHGLQANLWVQVGTGRGDRTGDELEEFMADVDLVALPRSVRTVPEHLHAAGYQTIGVATNPNLCDKLGFTRGFDTLRQQSDCSADEAVDQLMELAQELDETRPRFFFLHLNDPHVPYENRAPWCPHAESTDEGCSGMCRYESELSFLDSQLRRLFTELDLDEDAIVVLASDHGEEFRDHGDTGHRYSVHQELSRAVLMVKSLGVTPQRSALPAHHIDVLPTLLQLLNLSPPEERDGIALIPALDDDSQRGRGLITHRIGGRDGRVLWALTLGKWRLFEELPDGVLELYDTEADPFEMLNLANEQPELVAELREQLARIRTDATPLPREHVRVDMTEELAEQLIRLGYVGDQH
jgi:arylsulfatase A-like enzyme